MNWSVERSGSATGAESVLSACVAGSAKTAFDDLAELGFKGDETGCEELTFWHDDQIEARRDSIATEHVSNETLRAIPHDRAAQLSGGRDAKPSCRSVARQGEHDGVFAVEPRAPIVNRLELRSGPNSIEPAQAL